MCRQAGRQTRLAEGHGWQRELAAPFLHWSRSHTRLPVAGFCLCIFSNFSWDPRLEAAAATL